MDNRFDKIRKLLEAYSVGNFDKKLALSPRMDEVDAFIAGVNMLGEELKERTISRDYFNNIFNSVSDMVFVLDKNGIIENINNAVTQHLSYTNEMLQGKPASTLLIKDDNKWWSNVIKYSKAETTESLEAEFVTAAGQPIPVLVATSALAGNKPGKGRILMTAKDISLQKKTQNMLLQAIIETEEKERMRFAEDIHDSIGQQLSAIKFYIGTSVSAVDDPKQKAILLKANAALLDVQKDMRNICFNIMPKSLELFGLINAVEELCSKDLLGSIKISIINPGDFPRLPLQQEFALFRIVQEFINNSLKHSQADHIEVNFSHSPGTLSITLSDNGVGFDMNRLTSKGMGLNNVRSRVRPYGGEVVIFSRPGKGTRYEISLPITP